SRPTSECNGDFCQGRGYATWNRGDSGRRFTDRHIPMSLVAAMDHPVQEMARTRPGRQWPRPWTAMLSSGCLARNHDLLWYVMHQGAGWVRLADLSATYRFKPGIVVCSRRGPMNTYSKNPDAIAKLSPEQFRVTQQSATERPGTGEYLHNK